MSKVNLGAVKDIDLTKEPQGEQTEGKLFSADVLIDDAPEQPKKEKGTPGPKKRRKETTIKTFNLDNEVISKIEAYCEEHEMSASIFVNKVLKKEFGL